VNQLNIASTEIAEGVQDESMSSNVFGSEVGGMIDVIGTAVDPHFCYCIVLGGRCSTSFDVNRYARLLFFNFGFLINYEKKIVLMAHFDDWQHQIYSFSFNFIEIVAGVSNDIMRANALFRTRQPRACQLNDDFSHN